jgi:outer membrane protein assembly factor BamB
VLWATTVGGTVGEPIVADGRLYFASLDDHVYAYGLP